jgi:hypothetical protein
LKPIHHCYISNIFTKFIDYFFYLLMLLLPIFLLLFTYRSFVFTGLKDLLFMLSVLILLMLSMEIPLFTNLFFRVDIISDEYGLHFKLFWTEVHLPWSSICGVKPLFRLGFFNKKFQIVLSKSLPFYFRIFGFLYAFSFLPGLQYDRTISHFDQLNERISRQSRINRMRK